MIVREHITLSRDELSERQWVKLFKALTYKDADNTEWHSYQLRKGGMVRIPRGAWSLLPDSVRYVDRRTMPARHVRGDTHRLDFLPELDAEGFTGQRAAYEACMEEEQGLVIAQPGFGKTQVALAVVSAVQTPWLILVHTEDIFNQWVDYAKAAIPGVTIGRIQGHRRTWTNHADITVAMVQTIRETMGWFRREYADKYGGVIVDEAHHSPAETWELILNNMPGTYRLGFTATQTRADGKQALMKHLIGPVIFDQAFELKVPTRVVKLKTQFKVPYRGAYDWQPMLAALISDEDRNDLIASTAVRQLDKGQSILILSRRIEHLERIQAHMLSKWIGQGHVFQEQVVILTGKTKREKRLTILRDFRAGKIRCLLSTQLADEALDVPILSRVFLTFPGKHDGRLIQQIGRALREHEDKSNAVVFDVVDDKIYILRNQWKERKQTYDKLKIKTQKQKGEEEDAYVTQAVKRRLVADRVRERLGRSNGRNRGS